MIEHIDNGLEYVLRDSEQDGRDIIRIDKSDPINDDVVDNLQRASKKREKKSNNSRAMKIGVGALIGAVLVTGAASYRVWTMAGSPSAERVLTNDNIPELAVPIEEPDFYRLSVNHEDDVWQYTALYSRAENVDLAAAMEIVAEANPDIDFHKIPVGGKINVPALPFAALADQEGLETDQPIGDVHVN